MHLDQIQRKPMQSKVIWRGPPVEGWGGEQDSIHLDQIQPKPVEGWGEKRVSIHLGRVKPKGVQSIVVWGGAPVEGWVSKHVSIQLDQIQPEGLQTREGCGEIQQVTLAEPIPSKGTQCADGWGQWAGDSASCASTKNLCVPAQKPIGIRISSQRGHQPNTWRRLRQTGYRNL